MSLCVGKWMESFMLRVFQFPTPTSVIHFKWVQCTLCQLYLNTTASKNKIQYYKVISLQLIKINEKKKRKHHYRSPLLQWKERNIKKSSCWLRSQMEEGTRNSASFFVFLIFEIFWLHCVFVAVPRFSLILVHELLFMGAFLIVVYRL